MSRAGTWRWWLLASLWLHYGAVGLLAVVPRAPETHGAPPPIPLELRLDTGERVAPLAAEASAALRPRPPDRGSPIPGARPGPDQAPGAAGPPLPTTPDGSPEAPGLPEDPIDALRVALGWGAFDRSQLGVAPPEDAMDVTVAREPDLPSVWQPASGVAGTSLGTYVGGLEDLLRKRWMATDLSVADRARGVAGRVGVRYRVSADGRTSGAHVSVSSGFAMLDNLALQAVPPRVPPFPRDLNREAPLWHEVTLRYSNPFVATGR